MLSKILSPRRNKSTKPKAPPAEVNNTCNGKRTCMGYELGELLGSGGFSWVLEGRKDGKTVAMKFTKIVPERNERKFKRQQREIGVELDVLTSVQHANIVKMRSFRKVVYNTPDGTKVPAYCFAMEVCHRYDLFDYLYLSGKMEEPLARSVFKQLVSAVKHLHDKGFAHRDLKAQNVLFTDKFQVKLIDFGGASKLNPDGVMHTYKVGTRGHQAPELLLNRSYTRRCDVFSLGVLLFIIVTGHPPFKQALITDPWFKSLARTPAQYGRFWAAHKKDALSKELQSVIQDMICYQPQRRLDISALSEHPWIKAPGQLKETYHKCMTARRHTCDEKMLLSDSANLARTNKFERMY